MRAGTDMLAALLPGEIILYHFSVLSFIAALPVDSIDTYPAAAFADVIEVNAIPIKTQVGVGLLPVDARRGAAESLRAALVAAWPLQPPVRHRPFARLPIAGRFAVRHDIA